MGQMIRVLQLCRSHGGWASIAAGGGGVVGGEPRVIQSQPCVIGDPGERRVYVNSTGSTTVYIDYINIV